MLNLVLYIESAVHIILPIKAKQACVMWPAQNSCCGEKLQQKAAKTLLAKFYDIQYNYISHKKQESLFFRYPLLTESV